ncbi:MAG: hypothetical protein ABJA70_20115 [Chryseolinea sp.]
MKFRTDLLLKTKSQRGSVSYNDARTIGILFTVEDKVKHEAVKEFIKKFETDGKQVKVIEFLPSDKQNYEFKFDFFTENELSFWGKITSADAMKFVEQPFDFLFYLDTEPNPMLLHLLARSKAKCRVGRVWDNSDQYFEFMLNSDPNIKSLVETIRRYIIQIK